MIGLLKFSMVDQENAGKEVKLKVFMVSTDIDQIFAHCRDVAKSIFKKMETIDPQQAKTIFDQYEPENRSFFEHADELQEVINLWGDQQSRTQFIKFLCLRITCAMGFEIASKLFSNISDEMMHSLCGNIQPLIGTPNDLLPKLVPNCMTPTSLYNNLVCNFILQQYRYLHKVEVEPGDVFIDCGAYIGDTALWALRKGARVISLEPTPKTFETLKQNIELNHYSVQDCHMLGVSDQNMVTQFVVPNGSEDSAFVLHGEQTKYGTFLLNQHNNTQIDVTCVRLDDWLTEHQVQPTFIKMDIEGAELDALHGAEQTIKTLKPKLAICLYHRNEDMWQIPLYIHKLVPDYQLFCRENNHGFEFVMYAAVPNN